MLYFELYYPLLHVAPQISPQRHPGSGQNWKYSKSTPQMLQDSSSGIFENVAACPASSPTHRNTNQSPTIPIWPHQPACQPGPAPSNHFTRHQCSQLCRLASPAQHQPTTTQPPTSKPNLPADAARRRQTPTNHPPLARLDQPTSQPRPTPTNYCCS